MGQMRYAAEGSREGGEMRVMDHTGDSRMSWKLGDEASVRAAQERFDALMAKGFLAFRAPSQAGNKAVLMKAFDPNADIILSPALTAG